MHDRSIKGRGARAGLRPTPYAFIHSSEVQKIVENSRNEKISTWSI
jgi:hypothetical protein